MIKMKFYFYLIFPILLNVHLPLVGQGLAEKYINVKFNYSTIKIQTIPGKYDVTYSGPNNTFLSSYVIDSLYKNSLFQVSIGFGKFKGLNHTVFLEYMRGKTEKMQLGYSIGYKFAIEVNKNDFIIRPSVGILYGNTNISLERLNTRDSIIRLYDIDYEAKSANIHHHFSSTIIRPAVSFTYLIKQSVGITCEFGYDYAFESRNGKMDVYLEKLPKHVGDVKHNIIDKDYTVTVPSGEISKARMFSLTGFYWSIGISAFKSFDYD